MATPYAFVTLVTSDSYLPGALALVAALNELHPSPATPPEVGFQTVCLVTPETVDVSSIKLLRRAFNVVVGVEIIEQEDEKNLRLLGRPDLNTVLTKLHVFRLTQYSKIIFLDADVLPIRPLSHLFSTPHEFSAVPDVGWPDIFNSGVLVLAPGEDKFDALMELQKTKGSWDGGDQGLLNEWRGQDWNRLSFVYNTTPTAAYTYAPAYERFGSGITAIHFIGENKPWKTLSWRAPGSKSTPAVMDNGERRVYNYDALVDRWYDVYDRHYRSEAPSIPKDFEVQRYTSVWDEGSSIGTETQTGGSLSLGPAPGSVLGLDELRMLAVGGFAALGSGPSAPPSDSRAGDGEYRSMPLDGRIDLMRPQEPEPQHDTEQGEGRQGDADSPGTPRPTHGQMPSEQHGYSAGGGYHTPGPNEVPGAPYLHGHSLPPPEGPPPYHGAPSEQYAGYVYEQTALQGGYQQQQPAGQMYHQYYSAHSQPQQFSSPQQGQAQYPHVSPTLHPQRYPEQGYHDSSQSETPRATPRASHGQQGQAFAGGNVSPTESRRGHRERHRTEHFVDQGSEQQGWIPQGHTAYAPQEQRGHHEEQYQYGSNGGSRQYGGSFGEHRHRSSAPPAMSHEQGQWDRQESLWREETRVDGRHEYHEHRHAHSEAHHHHRPRQEQYQPPPPPQQPPAPPPPPPRPKSPPLVTWNPAVEPPPKEPPPISGFAGDTYFQNIWDQPPGKQHDATFQSTPSYDHRDGGRADAFFRAPPASTIPEQLIKEGQYANVVGHPQPQPQESSPEVVITSPTPDRSNVHAVFPWEEKPRHRPRRVFPTSDSPPPVANYIESERTSSPVATPPPVERSQPQIQSPTSPLSTTGWGLGFSNAWDTVPSIQRYASKLVGSPKIYQMMHPPPVPPEDEWRRWEKQRERDWQERQDASSMDGDDEDDEDDEDKLLEEVNVFSEGSSRSRGSTSSRRGSRALASRSKKRYRARGVQAAPETREEGVQCDLIEDRAVLMTERVDAEVATISEASLGACPSCGRTCRPEECVTARARSGSASGFGARRWAPDTGLLPSPVLVRDFRSEAEQMAGTPPAVVTGRSAIPFPGVATPSGLRSPATLGSPRTYSPPKGRSPLRVPSPKVPSPKPVSSPVQASSPKLASSPGPIASPVRVQSPVGVQRKATSPPPLTMPHAIASPRPSLSPQQTMSPRRMSSSSMQTSSRTTSPVIGTGARALAQSTPSPRLTRLGSLSESPQMQRTISADTAFTPSPATTHESLITPETTPIQARRGSRVWDPARGVDVFKRGSEEVLARFLRMGSFEDGEGKRQTST